MITVFHIIGFYDKLKTFLLIKLKRFRFFDIFGII
jgi:hypothetical protein